jgi:hypothetical protein
MRAALAVAALLAASCAAPPEVRAIRAERVESTADGTSIRMLLELANPNDAPVELTVWNYSVSVDGRSAYQGRWMASLTLPPRERMLTYLPAVIPPRPGEPAPSRWQAGGDVGYRATGQLDRLLYQLGINRLSAGFSVSGEGLAAAPAAAKGSTQTPTRETEAAPAQPPAPETAQAPPAQPPASP